MSAKKRRDLPAGLKSVRRRFERWRRARKVRSRIPDVLWASAVEVAGRYGIHRTAKALSVDYYALKKRVEQEAAAASAGPEEGGVATFLELARPTSAKMRVHLKGVESPDLAALSRGFWQIES